jgi:hypothetical protein
MMPFEPSECRMRSSLAAILLLLLARATGAAEPAPAAPGPNWFPLVRGSRWVYATDLPQGDWTVLALHPESISSCPPSHHCNHGNDPHEHGDTPVSGKTGDEKHEHLVFYRSVTATGSGRAREVTVEKEWLRRDEDGELLCGRRQIVNDSIYVDPPQVLLPADPRPGKTWSWSGTVGVDTATIAGTVEAEETVQVPAGSFKSLRVRIETATSRGKGRATRWYAAGVGLVKEEVEIPIKEGPPARTRAELKSWSTGPSTEAPERR